MTTYFIDNYHGYPLGACEEFWNLTSIEIKKLAHGCGPGSGIWEKIVPDNVLGADLTPACDIHDVECYFADTKEELAASAENFLFNMLRINDTVSRFWLVKIIRRNIIMNLYYVAIVDVGNQVMWWAKVKRFFNSSYQG